MLTNITTIIIIARTIVIAIIIVLSLLSLFLCLLYTCYSYFWNIGRSAEDLGMALRWRRILRPLDREPLDHAFSRRTRCVCLVKQLADDKGKHTEAKCFKTNKPNRAKWFESISLGIKENTPFCSTWLPCVSTI